MSLIIPELHTERLLLRGHRVEDFPAMSAMWADPNVVRFIGGTPQSDEQSWQRLLRYWGTWAMFGFGYWAVIEKQSSAFIGELGLARFHRAIEPALEEPEMGWAFVPSAQGKGYAREAADRVISWADEALGQSLCCIISESNYRSLHLAQKCGFCPQLNTLYHGEKVSILKRPSFLRLV